jgi:hypothetical protein
MRLDDAVQPPTEARITRDPAVEGAGRCPKHRPQNFVLADKGSSETESSETGCSRTGLPVSGETGTRDVGTEDTGT